MVAGARCSWPCSAALWFVVTLPFRLVFWIDRLAGTVDRGGAGVFAHGGGHGLWAGPLFFIGIPLFLVGLVLTLRCLD